MRRKETNPPVKGKKESDIVKFEKGRQEKVLLTSEEGTESGNDMNINTFVEPWVR